LSQANQTERCRYIDTFNIEKGTCVTIKLKCQRSGLVQEMRVKRKQDDIVHAWFREYSGIDFQARIDLVSETVTLVGMNYSWHPQPQDLPRHMVSEMAHMMTMRRIRGQYELIRSVRPVKSTRRGQA
jgi:hypothetical protein